MADITLTSEVTARAAQQMGCTPRPSLPLTAHGRRVVEDHDWLARDVAASFRPPPLADRADVLAWCRVGLVRAAQLYDPAAGAAFRTYAWYWCRSFAVAFLRRELGRGVRSPKDGPQVAWTHDRPAYPAGDGGENGFVPVPDHRPPPGDPALRAWCSEEYARQRRCLDLRSRVLLYLRFVEGLSGPETGAALGVSKARVQQLEERAVRKLAAARNRRRLGGGRQTGGT